MDYFPIIRAKILTLLLHVSLLYSSISGQRSCPASLNTVKTAKNCPTDQDAWLQRERVFNCSSHKQNCTYPEFFVYHCIPNAWQNGSVEVCAIRTTIIGWKCPEFNFGGKMVQEHNKGHCRTCPFKYNSTDAFKYGECFKFKRDSSFQIGHMKTFSSEPTSTTFASTEGCTGFRCLGITLGVALGIVVAVLFAAISGFVFYKKQIRKDVKSSSNQERHPHKETDSRGHKSEGYEEENITLVQHGNTFKNLNQEVNTFHDPLHAGYFSETGQQHTPYIPSTHDQSFTSKEAEEENPAFLEYASKSIRLLSFSGFSPQEMVENLASDGFFYAGYDSTTVCFQCGFEKGDWKLGDDVIFEHKELNSRCPFVRDTENARGNQNLV